MAIQAWLKEEGTERVLGQKHPEEDREIQQLGGRAKGREGKKANGLKGRQYAGADPCCN